MKTLVLILVMAVVNLLVLGSVMQFSCAANADNLNRFVCHLGWIALGLACGGALAMTDYSRLLRWRMPGLTAILALVLLTAVLIPGIGISKNGAMRWLPAGQPSEFSKFALILFLAAYAARHQERMARTFEGFLLPMGVVCAAGCLVFLEPDWGTAGLICAVGLGMLFIGGAHWGCITSCIVIGLELFVLLLVQNSLRLERFLAFQNPQDFRDTTGWQAWLSELALGRGGWFGTYFGNGSLKNGFIPEQHTDFILSLIGEELGFAGTCLVLILFACILICGARIAWKVADSFGQLLAVGIVLLIGLQAFINIGVVTGILPNKGMPLPFVSCGGSSIVVLLSCTGLLVSVALHGPVLDHSNVSEELVSKPIIGGPVGSLLENSLVPAPVTLPQRLMRAMRHIGRPKFPTEIKYRYQKPPLPVSGR